MRLNGFGKLAGVFVDNGKLSLMLFASIIFCGVTAYLLTPKQYNPDIVAPAFQIRVDVPGSTAQEVYELVTKPLEDVVHEIPGVEDIFSKSVHGGVSVVTVRFFVGEDMERSMIRLRQKLDSNLDLKPVGVSAPRIETIDPDDLAVMTLVLKSETLSPIELRRRAHALKDDLKLIPDTSLVHVVGGRRHEMRVELDAEKLFQAQSDVTEIENALRSTSILSSPGPIKGTDVYTPVEIGSHVDSLQEIRDLLIVSNTEFDLKASDVGSVASTAAETLSHTGYYARSAREDDAVFLTIAKKKGANGIPLSKQVHETLARLQARAPYLEGVAVEVLRDSGKVAEEEIGGLMRTLVQAILVVFAILFLFLSRRAALIVALSIPLSLLSVMGLGLLFGYTVNRITLFALILSLGLLVDSATVVVENIVRNKRAKPERPIRETITLAVSEIGGGLLLSTITTVLAFIPMAYVTGMMGPYMGPIPFFVPAALGVSLLLAYSLNPWLASVLFTQEKEKDNPWMEPLHLWVHRIMQKYERLMEALLTDARKRKLLLGGCAVLVLVAVSLPAVGAVRFRMLPKADRNQMYVYLDLDRGAALERTHRISEGLAETLLENEFVSSIQAFVGQPPILDFNGLFKGADARSGTHQATLRVNLVHASERRVLSEDLAVKIRQAAERFLAPEADARLQVIEDPPGPPVQSTFVLKIKGTDPVLLKRVAAQLESQIRGVKGLTDIDHSIDEPLEKLVISVDRARASRSKVTTAQIAQALNAFYGGARIGIFHNEGNVEQEYIVLRFPRAMRSNAEGLKALTLTNQVGNSIPVTDLIRVESGWAEEDVRGDNRERVVYLTGEMERRSVTYAALDVLGLLRNLSLEGQPAVQERFSLYGIDYRTPEGGRFSVEVGGEWDLTLDVFRDLGTAMAVAVFLIYFVMVVQFKSFRMPLYVLATIPLALIGVMPGFALLFALQGVYFSATAMIGVIALSGIVVNNAILLVEYINQLLRQSKKSLLFVLIVACKTRMRPILLTSLTTVLGTLMIAADPVWAGLAWSIVFGLSFSAVLTLIIFPVLLYQFHSAALGADR